MFKSGKKKSITQDDVLKALAPIKLANGTALTESGLMSQVVITGSAIIFSIEIDPTIGAESFGAVRQAAQETVEALKSKKNVLIALTGEKPAGQKSAKAAPPARPGPQQNAMKIAGVDHVIAVASGKGGVGKSTSAINIALGLQAQGKRVGILDADIYGPSMPRLFGLNEKPTLNAQGHVRPLEKFGLKIMSIGFVVDEDTAVVWRGPMAISAIRQFLHETDWGELDILVIDMPPGTGDVHLSMAQQVALSGAVIISTPQDLALIDARKGINMFEKVNVPILGIVENMSYFLCPKCGERTEIFGHGGARDEAEKLGTAFLGQIPLHLDIRLHSDSGNPIVAAQPESEHAKTYLEIAKNLLKELDEKAGDNAKAAPNITFE